MTNSSHALRWPSNQSRQYNLDSIRDKQTSPKIFIQIETGYIVAYQTRGKIGKYTFGIKGMRSWLNIKLLFKKRGRVKWRRNLSNIGQQESIGRQKIGNLIKNRSKSDVGWKHCDSFSLTLSLLLSSYTLSCIHICSCSIKPSNHSSEFSLRHHKSLLTVSQSYLFQSWASRKSETFNA